MKSPGRLIDAFQPDVAHVHHLTVSVDDDCAGAGGPRDPVLRDAA